MVAKLRKFHVKLNSPYRYIFFPRAGLLVVNVTAPPRKVERVLFDNSCISV